MILKKRTSLSLKILHPVSSNATNYTRSANSFALAERLPNMKRGEVNIQELGKIDLGGS
jgi:hypothetical protein